jgi:hypothetical protein
MISYCMCVCVAIVTFSHMQCSVFTHFLVRAASVITGGSAGTAICEHAQSYYPLQGKQIH